MLVYFVIFVLGIIVGFLLRPRAFEEPVIPKQWQQSMGIAPKAKSQFIEPVSTKEKFEAAKEITDLTKDA